MQGLGKYIVTQIPGLVLLLLALYFIHTRIDMPGWMVWGIIGLWIIKDILLFPLVRRAFHNRRTGSNGISAGDTGITAEKLAPAGYIKIRGELWRAETADKTRTVPAGKEVWVKEIRGLTLVVEPENLREKENT